jgi:hypothetical protein
MPLAVVMMSGVTPKKLGWRTAAPVRPKPVITSSKISRMPVLVADRPQALEVALRRRQHPAAPATGSIITAAMVSAPCSATSCSSSSAHSTPCSGRPRANALRFGSWVWRRWSEAQQRIDPRLLHQPAHRDAAEAHAVVAALAPDQPHPLALAAGAVVGDGHLQRRVGRLRARS